MAASGFTPIQLYYSATVAQQPLAVNLASGELAINITDGKLYYKDNTGAVQLIANKNAASLTLPLTVLNGGTGTGTFSTGIVKSNGALSFTNAVAGTDYAPITTGTEILAGNGSGGFANLPSPSVGFLQWSGSAYVWNTAIGSGSVTSVSGSGGTTGLTLSGGPITTVGTLTLGGTLNTANGGTGLTSFTSGKAIYSTSTSALTSGTLPTSAGGTGISASTAYSLLMGGNFGTWVQGTISGGSGISVNGTGGNTITISTTSGTPSQMYFYGQL
jgi:hypothetical protein